MARKTFNVLFFIKKARLLKNGEAPVCMRITVNGCMVDVLVKRSCPVNLWNQAKENSWKIQCKLPPKTKRFCPLKTFNNAPLKSLDRWGYYYFRFLSV